MYVEQAPAYRITCNIYTPYAGEEREGDDGDIEIIQSVIDLDRYFAVSVQFQ
jgi:hypothetical protein